MLSIENFNTIAFKHTYNIVNKHTDKITLHFQNYFDGVEMEAVL